MASMTVYFFNIFHNFIINVLKLGLISTLCNVMSLIGIVSDYYPEREYDQSI